jgi:hypothetical protein
LVAQMRTERSGLKSGTRARITKRRRSFPCPRVRGSAVRWDMRTVEGFGWDVV